MTETQALLSKIASLRHKLEKAQGLMKGADAAADMLAKGGDVATARRKVEASARQQSLLETALRKLPGIAEAGRDGASLPAQLTSRAARLLRRAHELLAHLRGVAENSVFPATDADPLAQLYRETVSMTDMVLRTVQAFPESPSAQMRLCEGLDAVINVAADRLTTINAAMLQRRRDANRQGSLADILSALALGKTVEIKTLQVIAESVQDDMLQGAPLQFPEAAPDSVPRYIAAHSLAVAQVIARLARQDVQWQANSLEPIIAALVHDVGMVKLPATLLGQSAALSDDQRRLIESHVLVGPDMAARITPKAGWLVEAAGQHHERLDGTGYAGGLRDLQIKPLIRLLSVCDVYAAMCQPRPYRAAFDTRTALTDTLLLAQQGHLDPGSAERLLQLSFYPVGTAVELSDGAAGVVVATHQSRRDFGTPARPVVALLTDHQGRLLPALRHVDLAEVEARSIVRMLPVGDRREKLGRRYPELIG